MNRISFDVDSWIIQDGNYPDLAVGQELRCAFEFGSRDRLHRATSSLASCSPVGAEGYDVTAQVVFRTDTVWVIDCGIKAYREERPPKRFVVGDFISGTIELGIDPYFYSEYLHEIPGMPNLWYDIIIESISLETTPWVRVGKVKQRDPNARRAFLPITNTNAWSDDDGDGNYLVSCRINA